MRPSLLRERLLDVCLKAKKKFCYVTCVGVSYLASGSGNERVKVKERYCEENKDGEDSLSDIANHSVAF